jgi:hypothetical protein
MINCGTVPVPVPTLEKFWFMFRIQTYLAQFFNNKFFLPILSFSMLETALFPRKLAYNFGFFDFCFTFYVGSGSKSGSGTGPGMHYNCVSGSANAKSCGSCCSGSTTLPKSIADEKILVDLRKNIKR